MPRCKNPLVVIAFDFGTTYSGYAFSYMTDPYDVQMNQNWIPMGSYSQLVTYKTPTSVLLDRDGQCHEFGYKAEDKFAQLAEDDEHTGWRLFRRFKMILHNDKNVSHKSTVEDLQGKPHPAMEIFSMAITYLHKHAKDAVKLQRPTFPETDFQYVITVPAIWDSRAKCFMREAAQLAGLDGKRLELTHEPEAAAIWCSHDAMESCPGTNFLSSGRKYMAIDLGGGTADISVYEATSDGSIKVIHKPSGGPWGGIYVDEHFLEYLENIFGKETMDNMRENHIEDYFDLIREFEHKKRSTEYRSTKKFVFKMPSMSYRMVKLDKLFDNFAINCSNGKMRIESADAEAWFEKPVSNIIGHIQSLLQQDKMNDINTLLLVGGFGESKYVQARFQEELAGKCLIVPKEPGLAVLKGAVLIGHNPGKVTSRVMVYSYGLRAYKNFVENKDPIEKKVLVNDVWKVDDVFNVYIKANEEVTVDKEISHYHTPATNISTIDVYRTLSEKPEYTTDPGCEHLCSLELKNTDNLAFKDQKIKVTFMFGNTELLVKVYHTVTGKEEMQILDCLQ
ncbi:heat shock 70 kDa protein 12B-like isoform X2 [Dreissena polymorpha]|nr:heat shock 70 kDa protein 12B-like isoform X2 [Dreissena polymorpha]XP_052267993.1 heat shock 70 kDa protein 12B-like isoform X2 [Dreissena polymorpha]XP_052267994.1 heat shock 70 kDa protein 12B-like isoform X2 [Dreissena polymorpha]